MRSGGANYRDEDRLVHMMYFTDIRRAELADVVGR